MRAPRRLTTEGENPCLSAAGNPAAQPVSSAGASCQLAGLRELIAFRVHSADVVAAGQALVAAVTIEGIAESSSN